MEFTLYWLDGKKEIITGSSMANAMNKTYSSGALRALDFWAKGKCNDYVFVNGKWTWSDEKLKELGFLKQG
jgi:hypothetical protein